MPRAMACARAHGVAAQPYPVDYQMGAELDWSLNILNNLQRVDLALHEWAGLVYYRLSGRI